MSEKPQRLEYAGPLPPVEREPGFTVGEHAAMSGLFVSAVVAITHPGIGVVPFSLWAFGGGLWGVAERGGRSVPGWIGVAVGGAVSCAGLAYVAWTGWD